jgi:predicted DNA-binding transcriptional regulator AlpA
MLSPSSTNPQKSAKPKPQVAVAQKAAALKASKSKPTLTRELMLANAQHQAGAAFAPDQGHVQRKHGSEHLPRGPPHLLFRQDVLAIARLSYPTIWAMMRNGTFPRSRICGGKSAWISTEVETWLAGLPIRPLKGDASVGAGA